MKIICLLFSFFIGFEIQAQVTDSVECPKIQIEGPYDNKVPVGDDAVFIAKRFKKSFEKSHEISYSWTIINGKTLNGADTRILHVDTKGKLDQQITAVLIINGLNKGCPNSKSITIEVTPAIVRSKSFDIITKNPNQSPPKL